MVGDHIALVGLLFGSPLEKPQWVYGTVLANIATRQNHYRASRHRFCRVTTPAMHAQVSIANNLPARWLRRKKQEHRLAVVAASTHLIALLHKRANRGRSDVIKLLFQPITTLQSKHVIEASPMHKVTHCCTVTFVSDSCWAV